MQNDPADRLGCSNLYMCFRWLFLQFKREFAFSEVLRLWEVRVGVGGRALRYA